MNDDDDFEIYQLMITLKFSRNAKLTCALTSQRPVRPAADDDFDTILTHDYITPSQSTAHSRLP